MKLTVLGGGGFRVPYVYQALMRDQGSPRIEEVSLYDTDATRLKAMAEVSHVPVIFYGAGIKPGRRAGPVRG